MFGGITESLFMADLRIQRGDNAYYTHLVFDEKPTSFLGELTEDTENRVLRMTCNKDAIKARLAEGMDREVYIMTNEFGIRERSMFDVVKLVDFHYLIRIKSGFIYAKDKNGVTFKVDELGDTEIISEAESKKLFWIDDLPNDTPVAVTAASHPWAVSTPMSRKLNNDSSWFDGLVTSKYGLINYKTRETKMDKVRLYSINMGLEMDCYAFEHGWTYQRTGDFGVENGTIKFEFEQEVVERRKEEEVNVEVNAKDSKYQGILGDDEEVEDEEYEDDSYDVDAKKSSIYDEDEED